MNAWFRFTIAALLSISVGAANVAGAALDAKTLSELKALTEKATSGDAESQFLLGAYYDTGKGGLPVNLGEAAIWYRKAAGQGYAMAQNALGTLYNGERLGAPDYGKAIQWFRAAADQGLPLAEYNLGYMYYAGRGAKQDHREALRWIGKSAAKGFAIAQFTVGKMLDAGAGLVNKNQPEAFRWFQLAANQDHAPSQYKLGVMLFHGHGAPQDFVQAFKWLRLAANQGVPSAKEALKEMQPLLDARQAHEAANLASRFTPRKSADSTAREPDLDLLAPTLASGNRPFEQATIPHMTSAPPSAAAPNVPSVAEIPPAASTPAGSLPSMPLTTASGAAPATSPAALPGRSTPPATLPATTAAASPAPNSMAMARPQTASPPPAMLPPVSEFAPVELVQLKFKAVQGDAESQFQLGRVFARGDRVNQNFIEAIKWHTLAAQQGHAGAQAALGTMHYWGRGASQDFARAAQWLLLSAEQGNSTAQFWLGMIYERGDPKERLKWFREAAEHGSILGQTYVAGLYLSGAGGATDPIEAYKWLELAANKGGKNAAEMRATLADVLSEKEIAEAKARALQFIPRRKMAPLNR